MDALRHRDSPFETSNVVASYPELVSTLSAEYDAWNDSCRDSYNGADYGIEGYSPRGIYKEDADL